LVAYIAVAAPPIIVIFTCRGIIILPTTAGIRVIGAVFKVSISGEVKLPEATLKRPILAANAVSGTVPSPSFAPSMSSSTLSFVIVSSSMFPVLTISDS